jgi:hypothetical protein
VSALGEPSFAWEPLTPRGVAAFARASFERLFIVQSVFAFIAAAAVYWFLSDAIFPVIDDAIDGLPDTGGIYAGKLVWRDVSPVLLAEGKILSLAVDLDHGGQLRSPADFQFEFGRDSLVIVSLLGEAEVYYPSGYFIAANHRDARPAWGAWAPNILALAAIGTFFGLLFIWALLATVYAVGVWIFCFFANRDLSLSACWKLAGAALLPGAALMSLSLMLYVLGLFDLVQFSFAAGMHLVIGWLYLFISPMFLNRSLPKEKANPFGPPA